jgi:glyoxylase-like metal-dependent hydrolase (beta-lactamase superfamily II)
MKISVNAFGEYQTNCYIVKKDDKEFIIDPGKGASKWVLESVKNPIAIINTHGHFDHIWDNALLQKELGVPLICSSADEFMLKKDQFDLGTPPSVPDMTIQSDGKKEIGGVEFEFILYPGHTPGCMAIIIEDAFFSGDFVFANSIGRVDLPYSNPEDMRDSIKKLLKLDENYTIYPGHGNSTTLEDERKVLEIWANTI